MEFIKAIFSNVLGIDGLIIILVIANIFFVGYMVRRMSGKIELTLRKVVYKPIGDILKEIVPHSDDKKEEKIDLHRLKSQLETQQLWYQMFISITSILPMMGILGTVISLLSVTAMDTSIIQVNFMTALSSTFWGIVGAIICRIIEGTLTPAVERNTDNFDMLISKIR